MKTIYYDQGQSKEVSELLQQGKIVAFPTDTVYGLGVIANNSTAIKTLKKIKNRPDDKAFAYMVDSLSKIEKVCDLRHRDRWLISRYLPGPFTFIFNKKKKSPIVNESKLDTLAIRIPDHPFILEVIALMDVGLYVPSANRSNDPPATSYQQVREIFEDQIDGIVMGHTFNGSPSTIVDCTTDIPRVIRQGEGQFEWREDYE